MTMIKPMLATEMPEDFDPAVTPSVAEVKQDGHRILIKVDNDGVVTSWSRNLKDSNRKLDDEIKGILSLWSPGVYDGELTMGTGYTSSDAIKVVNRNKVKFVAFDMLAESEGEIMSLCWDMRRVLLEDSYRLSSRTTISNVQYLSYSKQIYSLLDQTCTEGEEGLIIKRRNAIYEPGKRRNAFMKLKKLSKLTMKIVNYIEPLTPTEYGVFLVEAMTDEPRLLQTGVKVPNRKIRDEALQDHNKFLGKKIIVHYQDKTPHGQLRHPRFAGFVDE